MDSNIQPFATPRLSAVRKSISWFSVITITQKCILSDCADTGKEGAEFVILILKWLSQEEIQFCSFLLLNILIYYTKKYSLPIFKFPNKRTIVRHFIEHSDQYSPAALLKKKTKDPKPKEV